MDETTRERFHKTVEYFTNRCQESQWKESKGTETPGKTSEMWPLPADSCKHELGRTLSIMEFLHKASNQESDAREAKGVSYTEAGRFKKTDHESGTKKEIPPTCNEHYIHDTRQQNKEIHGRSLDCLNTNKATSTNKIDVERNAKDGCRIEGGKYEDIQSSEYCPNRTRISGLHLALGKLLRIGAVGGTKWAPCKLVYPQFHIRNDGNHEPMCKMPEGGRLDESCRNRNSSPMLIEVIANEDERKLFASYVHHGTCKVSNLNCIKSGSALDFYVNEIQEYGFNHIILIGEKEFGIIFLDCYGRVFVLDTMSNVLWPIGDTLEEAAMKPWTGDMAWDVDEAGTVFELQYYGTVGNQEDQKTPKIEKIHKKTKSNNVKKGKKKNKKNSTLF